MVNIALNPNNPTHFVNKLFLLQLSRCNMLERQGIIHANGHASINYTNVHVFSPITEFRLGNTLSIFAGYVIKLTCCEKV